MKPITYDQVKSKIIEVRDQKVILDSDVAKLYGVETRTINQAIKRNGDKFPDGYIIELTKPEWEEVRSQFVMSPLGGDHGVKTLQHTTDFIVDNKDLTHRL